VERRRFDEAGDALERAHRRLRVAAEEADGAGGRADKPQHHPQRGRLAGPVRAEVAEDVARLDAEVDVLDRDQVAVALAEAPDLDREAGLRGLCVLSRRGQRALAAASAAAGGTEPTTM